ncbi:hypothetical protein Tco_1486668 [Tanacetum coccineum]
MLKVAPWKGVMRFGKLGKINRLELPQELSQVHNVFHVYNLKKCLSDDTLVIPLEEIKLDDKLNFVEEPVEIMDREVNQLKRSRIPIIKVRWNARRGPEYTWEREDQFKSKYPHLFANPPAPTTLVVKDHLPCEADGVSLDLMADFCSYRCICDLLMVILLRHQSQDMKAQVSDIGAILPSISRCYYFLMKKRMLLIGILFECPLFAIVVSILEVGALYDLEI